MKLFLARLKKNVWSAFEACLNAASPEFILGKRGTTRRWITLGFIVVTVAFTCAIPCFIVGLVNTIRGK